MAALSKLRSSLLQCRPLAQTAPQAWAAFSSSAGDAPAGKQPQQAQPTASPVDARRGGESRGAAASGGPAAPQQQQGGNRMLPPRGRGREVGATRLADSIGVSVDGMRPSGRPGQNRPQRPRGEEGGRSQGPPSVRANEAPRERQQAPQDDRRQSNSQRPPSGGGPRPLLPDRRDLSRQDQGPARPQGQDSRNGPYQGGVGGGGGGQRPPMRQQSPPSPPRMGFQGRPDARSPSGLQNRVVDRAAAAAEGFPGSQERAPRGLARRMTLGDDGGRRKGPGSGGQGADGGFNRGRGQGPSAGGMQRSAGGGKRGESISRSRRYQDTDDQDERRGAVMGAKPRRIVQNRQSERDIDREIDQVYDFEYNDIKEADRLLSLVKEEDAAKRARARAAGTPMEVPYQYNAAQIKHEYQNVATDDAIRDLFGEFDPRVNFSFSSMPPRRRATGTPENFLDAIKADMMEGLYMNEAEWEDAVGEVLVGFEDARGAMDVRPGEAEDEALDALVTAQLPQDHPYYKQVSVSVDAVKSNPFWSYKQKEVFVNRLVKDMHAAL